MWKVKTMMTKMPYKQIKSPLLCSFPWSSPTMPAGSQFNSVTLLNYQRDIQMLPDNLMLEVSRFRRPLAVEAVKKAQKIGQQNSQRNVL